MASDQWNTVLHCGPATFLNRPHISCNRNEIQEKNIKAAILGYPFDCTTIMRTGSTMGPRRCREMSALYIPYHMDYDVNIVEKYNLHDVGDIPVKIGDAYETLQRGKKTVLEILHGGAMPVIIGGEHTSPLSATLAFEEYTPNARYGFILFDSHLDTALDVDGDPWNHCCPVTRTLELSCFKPENAVIIGPGGALNPKAELEYVRENNISLFTSRDVYKMGIEKVIEETIKTVSDGTDGVYITFDMDVLEASQTPGTCAPTPGGLTVREMIKAIDLLGQIKLIGFDVAEIAPAYDHSDITALTAARFILDMLASHARYL